MHMKFAVFFLVLAVIGCQARSYYNFDDADNEDDQYRRVLYQLMDSMMARRGTALDDLVAFFDQEKGNSLAADMGQSLQTIGKALSDYAKTGNKADEAVFRSAIERFAADAQKDGRLVTFLQKFINALHPAARR